MTPRHDRTLLESRHASAVNVILLLGALTACSRASPPEPQGTSAATARGSSAPAPSRAQAAKQAAKQVTHRADAPVGAGTFAWKAPLAVRVHESVDKQGNTADMTYVLDICPSSDGTFTVAHRDFTLHNFNGIRADDPRVALAMRELKPLTAAVPIFVVGADGRFHDLLPVDSMIARMRAFYDTETAERIERVFRNESAMKNLKQAVDSRWAAWVEVWIGIDWSNGSEQTFERLAPYADPSGKVRIKTVASFLGRSRPDEVKLSARMQIDEDKFSHLMSGASSALDAKVVEAKVRGRSETLLEAETAWPALKPSFSHTRKATEMEVDGRRKREIEDHTFRFDWLGSARETPKCKAPQ